MKDKITPTPWKVVHDPRCLTPDIVSAGSDYEWWIISPIPDVNHHDLDSLEEAKNNAAAIASAVNNTFGSGINPEAVPALLKALDNILNVHYSWTLEHQLKMIKEWAKVAIEKSKL